MPKFKQRVHDYKRKHFKPARNHTAIPFRLWCEDRQSTFESTIVVLRISVQVENRVHSRHNLTLRSMAPDMLVSKGIGILNIQKGTNMVELGLTGFNSVADLV